MESLLKHLPHYQEPAELILLKGHLLVEELLRGYLDRRLPNPTAFKHDQFPFAKVLMLCRALTLSSATSWPFDAASKLNDVRNEVAHELASLRLKTKIDDFIALVEQHAKDLAFQPNEWNEARLYMAITHLHHELSQVLRTHEG